MFILFFTVLTSVNLLFFISKNKNLIKFLFDRSDTSWIFTRNNILHNFRKCKFFFCNDFTIVDDVNSNIVIQSPKIKVRQTVAAASAERPQVRKVRAS